MKYLLYFFILVSGLFIYGCTDPCEDVNCGTNGACDEGKCICDTGYEGELCDTLMAEKFFGRWFAADRECSTGNTISVKYDFEAWNEADEVRITTETTPKFKIVAKVIGDSLAISPQIIDFGTPVTYTGYGKFKNDILYFEIVQTTGDYVRTCTGNYVKIF